MIEVLGAHRVRMQLEACEVGHPRERGPVPRHHLFRATARREAKGYDFDPGRPGLRRALLIEEFAVDAAGIAHQHVGSPSSPAEGTSGDRKVVSCEIQLGVTGLREEHLPRVRDGYFAAATEDELPLDVHRQGFCAANRSPARLPDLGLVEWRGCVWSRSAVNTPTRAATTCMSA